MSDKLPTLHARIERTPDGLFKAVYPAGGSGRPGEPSMPDSHIAITEAEVRSWVEQMAKWSGFSGVAWEGPVPRSGSSLMDGGGKQPTLHVTEVPLEGQDQYLEVPPLVALTERLGGELVEPKRRR